MRSIDEIIVIGSGNWGLALASVFCANRPTRVWAFDQALADQLNTNRDNPGVFYPYPIDESITIEAKFASKFDPATTLIILAVPSGAVASAAAELGAHAESPLVMTVSKGYDAGRLCTMSALVQAEIPAADVVVLSGPTIANEVADGKPTRAVLAGGNLMVLARLREALANEVLSFEVSRNPVHHEICAALKGIVAIACGIADGLDLGANAQGILMTQGLHEMAAVAAFFDIPESVAMGISGAGDLITTCISPHSRNRCLGQALAKGLTLQQALDDVGMTVEGVAMSQTIETLWALDVSIPLFHMINRTLQGKHGDLRDELAALIRRI